MTTEKDRLREKALEIYRHMQGCNPLLFEAIQRFGLHPDPEDMPEGEPTAGAECISSQVPYRAEPRPKDRYVVLDDRRVFPPYYCSGKKEASAYIHAVYDYAKLTCQTFTKHQAKQKGLW